MEKTSKFKGVYLCRGKWAAFITVNGWDIGLGRYDNEEEASYAVSIVRKYVKTKPIPTPDFIEGEIWVDVPNFEGKYMASNLGRIKSINFNKSGKEGLLKKTKQPNDYERVCLSQKTAAFSVHRLVYSSFYGAIPDECVIHHKNSIRDDNRLENLECVNQRENVSAFYKKKNGFTGCYFSEIRKKWVANIHVNGKQLYLGGFDTKEEASLKYQEALKSLKKVNKYT